METTKLLKDVLLWVDYLDNEPCIRILKTEIFMVIATIRCAHQMRLTGILLLGALLQLTNRTITHCDPAIKGEHDSAVLHVRELKLENNSRGILVRQAELVSIVDSTFVNNKWLFAKEGRGVAALSATRTRRLIITFVLSESVDV